MSKAIVYRGMPEEMISRPAMPINMAKPVKPGSLDH